MRGTARDTLPRISAGAVFGSAESRRRSPARIGKALFAFSMEWSGVQSGYGSAGALVVFLVWVYYTARIIQIGAEVVAAGAYEQLRAGTTQLTARWRGV